MHAADAEGRLHKLCNIMLTISCNAEFGMRTGDKQVDLYSDLFYFAPAS